MSFYVSQLLDGFKHRQKLRAKIADSELSEKEKNSLFMQLLPYLTVDHLILTAIANKFHPEELAWETLELRPDRLDRRTYQEKIDDVLKPMKTPTESPTDEQA